MKLGDIGTIRQYREFTGQTQGELAQELSEWSGVEYKQADISRWENGDSKPNKAAQKFLKDFSRGFIQEF